jgi:hypothetical protein
LKVRKPIKSINYRLIFKATLKVYRLSTAAAITNHNFQKSCKKKQDRRDSNNPAPFIFINHTGIEMKFVFHYQENSLSMIIEK